MISRATTEEAPTPSTRQLAVAIVVVSLLSSTATAVAIQALTFNPIVAGQGPVESSGDIVLEDQDLLYTGNRIDAVNATINNTGSTAHDVDVHVAVKDSSGSVLVSKTTSATISANTVTTVTTDFADANEPSVDNVDEVEINLEATA